MIITKNFSELPIKIENTDYRKELTIKNISYRRSYIKDNWFTSFNELVIKSYNSENIITFPKLYGLNNSYRGCDYFQDGKIVRNIYIFNMWVNFSSPDNYNGYNNIVVPVNISSEHTFQQFNIYLYGNHLSYAKKGFFRTTNDCLAINTFHNDNVSSGNDEGFSLRTGSSGPYIILGVRKTDFLPDSILADPNSNTNASIIKSYFRDYLTNNLNAPKFLYTVDESEQEEDEIFTPSIGFTYDNETIITSNLPNNSDITGTINYEIEEEEQFGMILYTNSSEDIVVDKSIYLSNGYDLVGTLRNGCSITNPVLEININKVSNYNYCYIPKFNRYYYIDDIVSIKNNLWEFRMSVDVLMSFKEDILSQQALIGRNEFEFNPFVIDDNVLSNNKFDLSMYPYKNFITRIKHGEIIKEHIWTLEETTYAMKYNSSLNLMAGTSYDYLFTPNISQFNTMSVFKSSTDFWDFWHYIMNEQSLIVSALNMFQNPTEGILGNYVLPFDLIKAQEDLDIPDTIYSMTMGLISEHDPIIGSQIVNGANVKVRSVSTSCRIRMWAEIDENYPQLEFNSFIDTNPYSKYYMFLPFIGVQEIPAQRLELNMHKYIIYDVDVLTGDILCSLSATEPDYLGRITFECLSTFKGNLYTPIGIGHSNLTAIHQAVTLGAIKTAITVGTSVYSGMGDIQSGQSMKTPKKQQVSKKGKKLIAKGQEKIESGIISGINTSLNTIASLTPHYTSSGADGNSLDRRYVTVPILFKMTPEFFYPDNYNHYFGRPLLKTKELNEVHGFTTIDEIHLNGFDKTTDNEKDIIIALLSSGVILP